MAYLLDTHAILWFMAGDELLPIKSKNLIQDFRNVCFVSIASLWEITIKIQKEKLKLDFPLAHFFDYLASNQIEIIGINQEHLLYLLTLPTHHADPFDRMIISQAFVDDMTVITKDSIFEEYGVKVLWG
ncbi:MAG: type II toxin-antitoxin system VapC family toxin [Bacteroidota bacterium]